MKPRKPAKQNSRRRQACLLSLLAASIATGATATADGPAENTNQQLPNRLPAVAAKSAVIQEKLPRWNTSGVDLVQAVNVRKRLAPRTAQVVDRDAVIGLLQEPNVNDAAADAIDTNTGSHADAPARWLRSSTSSAATEVARRLLRQASQEYDVRAWLSAETTAWEALRHAAEAVELAERENFHSQSDPPSEAAAKLQYARHAIREARDFSGTYGSLDSEAIARMARSHRTDVLDGQPVAWLSATDASDRYLDEARVALAPIASRSIEAAQAMDLLAAIYLNRGDSKTLPSATALCLRRAALQGQPGDASLASRLGMHLADVGLYEEARWALEHSLSIQPDPETTDALVNVLRRTGHGEDAAQLIATVQNRPQTGFGSAADRRRESRPRIPQITELSPADFAALSKPVIPVSRGPVSNQPVSSDQVSRDPVSQNRQPLNASLASTRTNVTPQAAENSNPSAPAVPAVVVDPDQDEKPGVIRRLMNTFKRAW